MKPLKFFPGLVICCLLLLTACRHVEEGRFLAAARINDKPVRLAYDTGAEDTLIFNQAVKRLGLKGGTPPSGKAPPGQVVVGQTGLCQFKMGAETYTFRLSTLHLPWWWGFDVDGVIGWPDMVDDFIAIDAATATIKGLDKLPEETAGWLKLPLFLHTGVLALEIPRADGKVGVLEVDTGNSEGVSLSPARWKEWRAAHTHAHRSWTLDMMPGSGAVLGRKYKADEVTIGPLVLTNVPVRKANITEMAIAGRTNVCEGSIGFKALERLNLIVDRKNNVAYLQPKPALNTTNAPQHRPATKAAMAWTNSTVHLGFRRREYFDRGLDEFDAGKFDEAIADYTRYLELQPSNAWACAICGESQYEIAVRQGSTTNLGLALGNLDRALELDPEIVRAYFVRGNARYLMRKWDGARQDYRRYCELNPSDASYPSFFIWLIHARGGERAAADKELSACLDKLRKGDYGPWQKKIGALLLDRLGEAEFLRAAHVRDTGEQCEAWYYAGMKRQLAGDLATAKDYFQKCVATARKDFFEYNFAAAELKAME